MIFWKDATKIYWTVVIILKNESPFLVEHRRAEYIIQGLNRMIKKKGRNIIVVSTHSTD